MLTSLPVILLFGHSFIKRLQRDLLHHFDSRAYSSFALEHDAVVQMVGIGGRTVPKALSLDLAVIKKLKPDIVILELGTNDLSSCRPETVGSDIEDLVRIFLDSLGVAVVGVCRVLPCCHSDPTISQFNVKVDILNRYLEVIFEHHPRVFVWCHRGFSNPSRVVYLADGVHMNAAGQYSLYRSYRGAMLKALRLLKNL